MYFFPEYVKGHYAVLVFRKKCQELLSVFVFGDEFLRVSLAALISYHRELQPSTLISWSGAVGSQNQFGEQLRELIQLDSS